MPTPDNRSKYTEYKRTNLFLLRVWCDDPDHALHYDKDEDEQGDMDGNNKRDMDERSARKWHGRVQMTVSGEAHSFENKEALIEILESMLYNDRP